MSAPFSSTGPDGLNDDQFRQLRKGNPNAMEIIYNEYFNQLYGFVIKLVVNKEDAEDIVLDSFRRSWATWSNKDSLDHFKGSLFIIARNAAIDLLRRRQQEKILVTNFSLREDPDYIEVETERTRLLAWVQDQLHKLSSAEKSVIELYLEGKNYAEIAQIRDCSIQTVRSLRSTAVKKLKDFSTGHELLILFFLIMIFRNAENQPIESFSPDVVKKIPEKDLFFIDEI